MALLAVVGIAWIGGAFDSDDDTLTGADPSTTELDEFGETLPTGSLPTDSLPTESLPTESLPTDTVSHALPAPPADPSECPAADGSAAQQRDFAAAPPLCIDPAKTYTALVSTNHGDFTVELDPAAAPITVNNFVVLARYHYFDDTICHRIIPGFVVQCGDPTGTGSGGPGYAIADELPAAGAYQIGSLAMANSGPDTNGSQFFVITGEDGAALDAELQPVRPGHRRPRRHRRRPRRARQPRPGRQRCASVGGGPHRVRHHHRVLTTTPCSVCFIWPVGAFGADRTGLAAGLGYRRVTKLWVMADIEHGRDPGVGNHGGRAGRGGRPGRARRRRAVADAGRGVGAVRLDRVRPRHARSPRAS